jgi:hypothetical protein
VSEVGTSRDNQDMSTMSERQHTIVCSFDTRNPRIYAYQIHEWLHDMLHLPEDGIRIIQIDGTRRKVYVKFMNKERKMVVLNHVKGPIACRHENGELSMVNVEIAGM